MDNLNFKLHQKVKVVDKDSKTIVKEGYIVKLTTIGAYIYDNKEEGSRPEWDFNEFFAFECLNRKMVELKDPKKKDGLFI